MIVSTERWDLLSQCSPHKLGQLLSYILSDEYLYTHPKMRKHMQADRKGYVEIDEINKQPSLIEYFQINQVPPLQKKSIIREAVAHFCHELIVKGNRIRRIDPFNHSLFKKTKPLCIQKIKQPLTISDIRHYLGQSAFSEIQIFTPTQDYQFFYIFAPDYRQRKPQTLPFRLLEYNKVCAERERESRYWQQQQKRAYSALSVEVRRPMKQGREDYRTRMMNSLDEQQQMMAEEQNTSSVKHIQSIIKKPNPTMNQFLLSYMEALKNRLDQQ